VQRTVVACAVVAGAAFAVLTVAGRPLAGAALAAGLILGSANPWLARRSLGMEASFRTASLGRLGVLTAAGLAVGSLLGLQNAPLTIVGLGVAQLLLAGLAAKSSLEMLRT
jgi:hypothetical protein